MSLIFKIISVRPASLLSRKRLLVEGKNFSVRGKCPNFSIQLRLRTRGKLMLANFRLKIDAVWDGLRHRKPMFYFFSPMKGFRREQSTLGSYKPKSYLWTKMKELDFSTLATKLTFWSIFLFRTSQARSWGNKIQDSFISE